MIIDNQGNLEHRALAQKKLVATEGRDKAEKYQTNSGEAEVVQIRKQAWMMGQWVENHRHYGWTFQPSSSIFVVKLI